jgi:hypothetical protein
VKAKWPRLVLALAPILALWRCLVYGHSVGAFDQIRQMAPWNGPKADRPWDVLQADGVLQFYGWRDLVLSGWSRFEPTFWNPYQLAGTPLLANSQSGVFYPPHILLGVLQVPTGPAIVVLAWFHLAIAGLGMWKLVRALDGSDAGGVVAGLLFALSPFMLGWTGLPSVISTVAWIPWLLAAISERRRSTIVELAVFVGLLLTAGHLQFAAYGLMGATIFAIVLLARGWWTAPEPEEGPRTPYQAGFLVGRIVAIGASLALGGALAAVHLMPVLGYSQYSHRRNVPSEDGYNAYVASALRPTDFVSRLANPMGQGDPNAFVDPEAPFSTFWPAISRPGANFAESALTVGPFVLILIGLAIASRRRMPGVWPLAILAVFALLLAMGTPLNRVLYMYFPGWSSTGSPGRVICLFVLALCALAGLCVPERGPLDRKRAGIGIGIGALLAIVTVFPLNDPAPAGLSADAWAAISAGASTTAPIFLLGVLLAAGVSFAFATGERRDGVLVAGVLAVGAITYVPGILRTGDPSFLHSRPVAVPEHERVAMINSDWGLTQAARALYPPNTATPARIHDLGGYDSLLHRGTQLMLGEVVGGDPAPPANGNMMFVKPSASQERLAQAGVSEAWSFRELPTLGNPSSSDGIFRHATEGPGRISVQGDRSSTTRAGSIVNETSNSVTIEAEGPSRLTLRDRNIPGWTAWIGDRRLEIEGGPWLEVVLPDGPQTVTFRYAPPEFPTGARVSAIAAVAVILIALLRGRRKTLTPEAQT